MQHFFTANLPTKDKNILSNILFPKAEKDKVDYLWQRKTENLLENKTGK